MKKVYLYISIIATSLAASTENNRTSTSGLDTVPANWSLSHYPTTGDSVTFNGTTAGALDTIPALIKYSFDCFNLDSTFTGKWWSLQTATDTNYVSKSVFIKPAGTFNTGSGVWCQTGDANFTMANYSGTYTVSSMKLILQGTGTATFSKTTGLLFSFLSMGYPSKTTTYINNSGGQVGAATITVGTGTVSLPSGSYLYWAPLVVGDTFITAGTSSTFSGAGRIYVIFQNSSAMTFYLPVATYNQTGSWTIRKYSNSGTATCIVKNRWPATPTLQFYNQSASSSFYVRIDSTISGGSAGGFYFGASNASAIARLALNGDTLSLGDNLDLLSYNTGTSFDSLKGCMIIAKYNVSVGSNHTVIPGTSTLLLKGTSKQTIITGNKPFYNMIINPSTGVVCSVAVNAGCDSLLGSLTLTTGKFKESNKLYIRLDYTNNTNNAADSAIITNDKFVGRNFVRGAGSRAYITGNTYFVSNNGSNITTNGIAMGWFYVQKTARALWQIMGPLRCNRLQMDSGIVIIGYDLTDSVQIMAGDSCFFAANIRDTVYALDSIAASMIGKISYGSGYRKYWSGSVANLKVYNNGNKRRNIFVEKSSGGVTVYDSLPTTRICVSIGTITMNGGVSLATDTLIDTANSASSYGKVWLAGSYPVLKLRHGSGQKTFGTIYVMTACKSATTIDTTGNGVALTIVWPTLTGMGHFAVSDTAGSPISHTGRTSSPCPFDSCTLDSGSVPGCALTHSTGAWSGTPTTAGIYVCKVSGWQNGTRNVAEFDTVTITALTTAKKRYRYGNGYGY